jgi:hypothetical protein
VSEAAARHPLPERIPAPLDGGELALFALFPHVWTQPRNSRPFGLYWSDELGLGRLQPTPTPEELARFYSTETYDAYATGTAPAAPPTAASAERWRASIARASTSPGASIAAARSPPDAARGAGAAPPRLRHRLRPASCSASSRRAAAACSASSPTRWRADAAAGRGVRVLAGTAEALPAGARPARSTWDAAPFARALQRRARRARQRDRLVAPGGSLIVECHHAALGFQRSRSVWFHTDAGRHIWFWSEKSLRRALAQRGLAVERVEYDGYARQFAPWWIDAEREVFERLYASLPTLPHGAPPAPTRARAWGLLLRTALAPDASRYDAVRVYARLPAR